MRKFLHSLNRPLNPLIFLFLGFFLLDLSILHAQEDFPVKDQLNYYLRLKNEEFLQTMLPKEKFLLGIVYNVQKEINERRSEGALTSDLGIEEIVSPEDIVLDEYVQELQRVIGLLDEIDHLERRAKRKVDLRVLEALSELRKHVHGIIGGGDISGEGEQPADDSFVFESERSSARRRGKAEDDSAYDNTLEDPVALDDLFEQWKYNRILDYKVKLTKYEFLRTRLLKTATPVQERRMFQRDLRRALESYSAGDFPVSRLQLQDILKTYTHYRFLDDVLYYFGESCYGRNYFDEALKVYRRLVREYPQSAFCAKALVKLIYINYIYGEFDKLSETYRQLMTRKTQLDKESFSTVSYLVGYAHFKTGEYEEALRSLGKVASGTAYFFPSLYLSAACNSNTGKNDQALSIYHRLLEEENKGGKNPVLAQIQDNASLKLGLIYYERGENQKATEFFERVSQDYEYYDLSMMGKAWSAYRSGKPAEALRNVDWVLRHSVVSNYIYEARVLAASSKELLGQSEEAIEDLKNIYRIGKQADQARQYPTSRMKQIQGVSEFDEYVRRPLNSSDQELFSGIEQIRQFLQSSIFEAGVSDSTQNESIRNFHDKTQQLTEKIETLDRLEEQARLSEKTVFVEEIRRLRSDLLQTLQDHSDHFSKDAASPDEDPLFQRMGIAEYLKYIFRTLLLQTLREKEQTRRGIQEAEALLEEVRTQDQFEFVVRMEIRREELEDYYGKLNQYEVWLRENFPRDFRVELDRWANFSGYGISSITFARIKESERRIAQISQTIETVDRVFKAKKKDLEQRIQGLLMDVATIEEQMRQEAAKRDQKEKDRFFEVEYFEKQRQEAAAGKLHEKPDLEEKPKE